MKYRESIMPKKTYWICFNYSIEYLDSKDNFREIRKTNYEDGIIGRSYLKVYTYIWVNCNFMFYIRSFVTTK
jgi:hypothetical protein